MGSKAAAKNVLKSETSTSTKAAKQLAINKENSVASESIVRQRLRAQLAKDEAILINQGFT